MGYMDLGGRMGMATKEELRKAVLDLIHTGKWEWYTESGIEVNLKGVTDGDGVRPHTCGNSGRP